MLATLPVISHLVHAQSRQPPPPPPWAGVVPLSSPLSSDASRRDTGDGGGCTSPASFCSSASPSYTAQPAAVTDQCYPISESSGLGQHSPSDGIDAGPQTRFCDDLPATPIAGCLPPFPDDELESLFNSLRPSFTTILIVRIQRMISSLPDDSLDSQAQLLHFIIESIRRRGFKSTYWFKGKSLDRLRAALHADPSFSTAVRNLMSSDGDEFYDPFFHILRYVCRRPPSYKSDKSVHFANTVEEIDAERPGDSVAAGSGDGTDGEQPHDRAAWDLSHVPPFVASNLLQSASPFPPSVLTQLVASASNRIADSTDGLDREVHVVQGLLSILLRRGLIRPNPLTDLDGPGLRDALQRDPALWDALRELPQCEDDAFIDLVSLLCHYFCAL
ncbi:hypothetical protein AURDEDRAFT_117238 [Auricularia subglabra TFB-10046 SS5]|uniref:Uncharacterized protein n=1 Tax=Auricularia subglabra (strain TFB-10046 / SS5) TaxID=717982 RepID=J0WTM6_AURST|nr:hypothetical protein AURDEDRAFT_117238 [Auricularia subglabra TFB-10046 SS5]